MFQHPVRLVAVTVATLLCTTAYSQNYFPVGQPSMSGGVPSVGQGPGVIPSGSTAAGTFLAGVVPARGSVNYGANAFQYAAQQPVTQQPVTQQPVTQQLVTQQPHVAQAYAPQQSYATYAASQLPPAPSAAYGGSMGIPYGGQLVSQPVGVPQPMAAPSVGVGGGCSSGSCGGAKPIAGYGMSPVGGAAGAFPAGRNGPMPPIPTSGNNSGGPGFFFRYDRLYSSISKPNLRVGSSDAEGIFLQPGGGVKTLQNSFGSNFRDDDFNFNGNRFEFGFLDGTSCDCGRCGWGWVASILDVSDDGYAEVEGGAVLFDDPYGILYGFADYDGDGIDDDVNGDGVFGRFGIDREEPYGEFEGPTPEGEGELDLLHWTPYYDLSVKSRTDISGLALNRIRGSNGIPGASSSCGSGGCCFRWLCGVRYLNIRETFDLLGSGGFSDDGELSLKGRAKNFIIGPEIGLCLGRSTGPWSFEGQVRFTPAANFIRNRTSARMTLGDGTGQNGPLDSGPLTGTDSDDTEQFSMIGEWRTDVAYAVSDFFSLRAGYTGMFISEVSRGGGVNFSLPDFGVGSDRSDIYIHALTLGGEFVY